MRIKRGTTSNVRRFTLKHSTTAQGLTGLSSASAGLIISTICDNEATPTIYTVAAGNVESITTLGTYAAPTAGKCRFREVDAINHKGLYEFQFADARFNVASSRSLVISVTGAANLLDADYEIQLTDYDEGDIYNRLGAPAGASISADIATRLAASAYTAPDNTTIGLIAGYTDTIESRLPAALVGGKMDSVLSATVDVGKINGSATAAARLAESAGAIVSGAAVAGTLTTTQMTTNLTETTNDHYKGRIIIWTGGALKDQATDCTAYDGTTKKLTFTATTEAPAAGDPFIMV